MNTSGTPKTKVLTCTLDILSRTKNVSKYFILPACYNLLLEQVQNISFKEYPKCFFSLRNVLFSFFVTKLCDQYFSNLADAAHHDGCITWLTPVFLYWEIYASRFWFLLYSVLCGNHYGGKSEYGFLQTVIHSMLTYVFSISHLPWKSVRILIV